MDREFLSVAQLPTKPHPAGSGADRAAEHDTAPTIAVEEFPQPANPLALTPALHRPLDKIEPYVDAKEVARYLTIERRQVLVLTRAGKLPAHPVDPEAKRKTWRYKLSEVDRAIRSAATPGTDVAAGDRLGAGRNSGDNAARGSSRSRRRQKL